MNLIENNMRTYKGDLRWTPSKVIRILANTKYMGYQLPEKSKVIDTVRKKKVYPISSFTNFLISIDPSLMLLIFKSVSFSKGSHLIVLLHMKLG